MRRLTTCVMLASAHLSGSVPATKRLEGLVVPEWDWNPPYDEICLDVPTVTGRNGTEWTNNSRGLFIARPDGVPPAGGWPVLMTFTIIDFPTQKPCGLDGHTPSAQVPLAETCVAAFGQVCGTQLNQSYYGCRNCTYTHAGFLESHGCTGTSLSQIVGPSESGWPKPLCPQLPPLDAVCEEELSQKCPLGQARQYTDCELCVDQALRNASSGVHCGMAPESTRLLFCAGYVRPPYTELFSPFGSPHAMGMGCSCLNGTTYGCSAPAKNSTHHMPTGAGCTIDMFAGGLWMQRVKQYAIANGIAVIVANTYYLDAWESYPEDWEGGFDPPFFAALDAAMGSSTSPPPLRDLNPKQIAVHGWSGSAQMVSWVIQLHASGQLGGLRIIAGIMAAGGSYACYYTPPQARGVCANCTVGGSTFGDLLQCSNVSKANGQEPLCNYCCPDRFTEDWYETHPQDYVSHLWTFLYQTEMDSGADSCAAAYYHDEMLRHGAHSELMHVPMKNERCYSIGAPGDPAVPASDTFQRFCSNPNVSSINHTTGFAEMVEPVTSFMLRAIAAHPTP